MDRKFKMVKFLFECIRCCPHLVVFLLHRNRAVIKEDIARWKEVLDIKYPVTVSLIYLLSFHKAFRNVFYYRIGSIHYFLNVFCPQISTLVIKTKDIGGGLFIWIGFSTAIGAKSIGKNCMINQMVTIGNNNGFPTIKDNVRIQPGAIVVGNITIGNNVIIGANATVIKDVPDNCTAFAESARVIKWNESPNNT